MSAEAFNTATEVAQELNSRVASITVANGYATDIGLRVFRGRRAIDEDEHVPCAVIIEGQDTPGEKGSRTSVFVAQHYVLGGYAACDPDHPNDTAHKIISDLKRTIFKDGDDLGRRVRKVVYAGRDIGPRADGKAIVFALIEIVVSYPEDLLAG